VSAYPGKDEIADYLEDYGAGLGLPIRHGFRVLRLESSGWEFVAHGPSGGIRAKKVVIATGACHDPWIPPCSEKLGADVWQAHSKDYRSPSAVPSGRVLVVGGGNSAAQIAEELSASHEVTMASRSPVFFLPRAICGIGVMWFMYSAGVLRADRDAWISRQAQENPEAVIGNRLKKLIGRGTVTHVPHGVVDCEGSTVRFADGSQQEFQAVLWCTGFRPNYPWLAIPRALDESGAPRHDRGVSPIPGLYWLGLHWQTRMSSTLLNGVGDDARALGPLVADVPRHWAPEPVDRGRPSSEGEGRPTASAAK
jgi:putative flavoprotein involved in K+ transport